MGCSVSEINIPPLAPASEPRLLSPGITRDHQPPARKGPPSLGRVLAPNRGRPGPDAYLHACRSSPDNRKSTDTPGHRDRGKRKSTARRGCTPLPGRGVEPVRAPCAPRGPKAASLASACRPLSSPSGKRCLSPGTSSFPPPRRAHCARGFLHRDRASWARPPAQGQIQGPGWRASHTASPSSSCLVVSALPQAPGDREAPRGHHTSNHDGCGDSFLPDQSQKRGGASRLVCLGNLSVRPGHPTCTLDPLNSQDSQ